jgi:hypothetical protein
VITRKWINDTSNLFATQAELKDVFKVQKLKNIHLHHLSLLAKKFSLSCKQIRSIVDPFSCDHMRSKLTTVNSKAYFDFNDCPKPNSYQHLKRIAAVQILK